MTILLTGLMLVTAAAPQAVNKEDRLESSAPEKNDEFGHAVALSGSTALAAVRRSGSPSSDVEAVYVFERSGTTWSEQAVLTASDGTFGDQFGWSLALDGDTAAVGAPFQGPGAAYVFERSGTTWTETGKLTPSSILTDDFALSVSVSGDTILVGAPSHDVIVSNEGGAYVYVRNGSVWSEQALIVAPWPTLIGDFGQSVAVEGQTAVIGAPRDGSPWYGPGAAYVYTRSGTAWSLQQKLVGSDTMAADEFGYAVDLSGDTLVAGAYYDDSGEMAYPEMAGLAFDTSRSMLLGAWAYIADIDPTTAHGTFLTGGFVMEGLAWDAATDLVYSSSTQHELYAWDRNTIEPPTVIGAIGFTDVLGLAFDPGTGVLYGTSTISDELITIDTATGAGTSVGLLGFGRVRGLAFDPSTGTLFGADAITDELITIDATTGAGTAVGALGFNRVDGLAVDPATGTLYGSDAASGQLITIDKTTGAGTAVGAFFGMPIRDAGSAYVFVRNGTTWTEQTKLTASNAGDSDWFGERVSLDGDYVVAGARNYEFGGLTSPGAAFWFTRSGTSWTETQRLEGTNTKSWDAFGTSVAVDGARAMVGVPWDDWGSPQVGSAGTAYVFLYDGGIETYCTAGTSASGCAALVDGIGTASATASSGFSLTATGVEGGKDALFYFGANGRQANPWGNGTSYQCVIPPVKRAGLLSGVGSPGACDGSFAQDLNALWCPTCPQPAKNPGAGAVLQAQLWYRDPFNTSNQTTSISNAVEFTVSP